MKKILMFLLFAIPLLASKISLIKVDAMHCPLCTTAVKKAIKKVDGIQKVSVKLNTKSVTVIYDDKTKISEILDAIKTTSYLGEVITTESYFSK